MDLDFPRASQDGRVYWDSGPNDLLAQLKKTSLDTTPASTRLKRTAICAEFPSPTRPGAQSPADTSSSSSSSLLAAQSSRSRSTSTNGSTAGSRYSKRRRGASRLQHSADAESTSSPKKCLNEAALRRINEITNLLSLRSQQQQGASVTGGKKSQQHSASTSAVPLADKTRSSNIAGTASNSSTSLQKQVRNIKPPLPTSRHPTQPQVNSTARSKGNAPTSSSTTLKSFPPSSRASAPFGRSQSEQTTVFGAPANGASRPGIPLHSSPVAKRSRPTSFPLNSVQANVMDDSSTSDINLEDDSFDLAIGSMAEQDFEAMITSASQQASGRAKSSSQSADTTNEVHQLPTDKVLPADINRRPSTAAVQSASTSRRPPVKALQKQSGQPQVSSQQKLRAPFKAPARVQPPSQSLPTQAPPKSVPSRNPKQQDQMSRVKTEVTPPSTQTVHPELQAALDAGFDFAADDGDISF